MNKNSFLIGLGLCAASILIGSSMPWTGYFSTIRNHLRIYNGWQGPGGWIPLPSFIAIMGAMAIIVLGIKNVAQFKNFSNKVLFIMAAVVLCLFLDCALYAWIYFASMSGLVGPGWFISFLSTVAGVLIIVRWNKKVK
jgi:hypothetical protein